MVVYCREIAYYFVAGSRLKIALLANTIVTTDFVHYHSVVRVNNTSNTRNHQRFPLIDTIKIVYKVVARQRKARDTVHKCGEPIGDMNHNI